MVWPEGQRSLPSADIPRSKGQSLRNRLNNFWLSLEQRVDTPEAEKGKKKAGNEKLSAKEEKKRKEEEKKKQQEEKKRLHEEELKRKEEEKKKKEEEKKAYMLTQPSSNWSLLAPATATGEETDLKLQTSSERDAAGSLLVTLRLGRTVPGRGWIGEGRIPRIAGLGTGLLAFRL